MAHDAAFGGRKTGVTRFFSQYKKIRGPIAGTLPLDGRYLRRLGERQIATQFKAEYIVTHAITGSLAEGARVSAAWLKMNKDETEALVQRFVGYARELRGPNVKPVPPFLFEISKDSRDHSREVYEEVIMPGFRRMNPAPKIALIRFGAGVHSFWKAEKDLPVGIVPSVLNTWNDAVLGGYFV